MQSAPSEVLQNTTSVDISPETTNSSSQHGLSPTAERVPDGFSSAEAIRRPSRPREDTDTDNLSVGSRTSSRGRRLGSRWLSGSQSSSQETSPGSRIDAYERAHATPRKLSDGMIFQVIPTTSGKQSNISILDFPNEVLTHILSHLPPETLSSMSLVSRRFHKLVTTPPAWRIAFARYFPCSDPVIAAATKSIASPAFDTLRSERRFFTRLSALASWRSEYILRTRLLRSLGRGRPAIQATSKTNNRQGSAPSAAVITYSSNLLYPVSHLHATFGVGLNKKQPLFVHGASEQGAVSTSDPSVTKVGGWGLGDFEAFKHFADLFVGEAEYGLGPGNVVGMPNVMDLSQPYGKIYGEACPGGRLFFTSTMEQRGRFLPTTSTADYDLGIPSVTMMGCAITSVWIAKSEGVLKTTSGVFGCLAGFSNGVLTAYALGVNPVHDRRFAHGEPTAKWALCPGVPIVAIIVDEKVNVRRIEGGRVWAAVLNALGEVFYLTDVPIRPDFRGKLAADDMDRLAWQTGRSVTWHMIEGSRRLAKSDPFNLSSVDGSYTPRSSSDAQGLSKEQVASETQEIERFLAHKPKHFRSVCEGWDMRRKLIVDFAGDDHNSGGESLFLISCGHDESVQASIKRFTRCRIQTRPDFSLEQYPPISFPFRRVSELGTSPALSVRLPSPSPSSTPRSRTSSHDSVAAATFDVEWRISNFMFGHLRSPQITTVAADDSDFATLNVKEDPLLGMSGGSAASSPLASPMGRSFQAIVSSEIPGQRSRFMAIGTTTGVVLLWNMRSSISPATDVINSVQPFRCIYTRSPQISSVALTALYVVHGGNDGLVQAWDPIASTTEPVRTLNSRFSDRARRRIAQAEASLHGVGNNYYAAGAIVLDPDPTVLRGMVSLGTHLRFWSYSASAADAYKSRKRGQLWRRSERGDNAAASEQKFHHTGRGVLKDYIQNEKHELEREKAVKRKEKERLTGRFGTNLLGEDASEEEILAYATMLSEESFRQDEQRFLEIEGSTGAAPYTVPAEAYQDNTGKLDADMEEAIRLSLLDSEYATESPQTTDFDVPVRYAKSAKRGSHLKQNTATDLGSYSSAGDDDLELALRLSLAEQESRLMSEEEFPSLSASTSPVSEYSGGESGKGKSRKRSW